MVSCKMKTLLKGLRYISQIFENEKEPEMQIGNPTEVKHVAHIGWDGGAVDSPSWMNGFKAGTGFSSTPLGDIKDASWVSEDSIRQRDMKLSKNNRSKNMGSPTKSERSRKGSSNTDGSFKSSRKLKESSEILPDRKSRPKKSKESRNDGSWRSSRRVQTEPTKDSMSET